MILNIALMIIESLSGIIHTSSEGFALLCMSIAYFVSKKKKVGQLCLFLLVGFTVDIISQNVPRKSLMSVFNLMIYCLFEAYFFLYYLAKPLNLSKRFMVIASFVIGVWWIYTSFFISFRPAINHGYHPYFDMLYEGGGAVLAALSLLKLTQKDKEEVDQFYFWSLIILFYYTFCIFYIHTFNGLKAVQSVWYISRYIDALALLSYSALAIVSIVQYKKQEQREIA